MKHLWLGLSLALAVGLAPPASAVEPEPAQKPHSKVAQGLSLNWAGYAVATSLSAPQNDAVTEVSGQWTIPSLSCGASDTYSSAWVGIDGFANGTVEQIGTKHYCVDGAPAYSAWFQMFPSSLNNIGLEVKAGDTVAADVKYTDANNFLLTLNNLTTGRSFSTTQQATAQRQSAEWIVEAPSSDSGVLPLANFGSVQLSGATVTLNGKSGSISGGIGQYGALTMVTADAATVKAQPSGLSRGGRDFSVAWRHS